MSTTRLTISVPAGVAARIRKAAAGRSVSAWVTGVIEEHLDDAELERLWDEFCRDVAPSRAARKRAGAAFKRLVPGSRRKSAA